MSQWSTTTSLELLWPSTALVPVEPKRESKSKEDEYKHNKAGLAVWLAPADAQWGEGRLDGGIFKLY